MKRGFPPLQLFYSYPPPPPSPLSRHPISCHLSPMHSVPPGPLLISFWPCSLLLTCLHCALPLFWGQASPLYAVASTAHTSCCAQITAKCVQRNALKFWCFYCKARVLGVFFLLFLENIVAKNNSHLGCLFSFYMNFSNISSINSAWNGNVG